MKVLFAADGSKYTKKALAFLVTHESLTGPSDEVVVLNVQAPVPGRVKTMVGAATVSSTSDALPTLITFITGFLVRALMSATRSGVSEPWSCSMSSPPVPTYSVSSASSGSTNRPTRVTVFGTRAPSARIVSVET